MIGSPARDAIIRYHAAVAGLLLKAKVPAEYKTRICVILARGEKELDRCCKKCVERPRPWYWKLFKRGGAKT